jgi:hypothetical protein
MKQNVTMLFLVVLITVAGCHREHETTIDDLGQAMMDLRIYQENLGDMIKDGDLQDAGWLLDGTDSLLRVMANTFNEHRKLKQPFSHFYKKRMKGPLDGINKAIRDNDTATAIRHYRVLVRRCNSCHTDHDVDKEVRF